MAETTVQNRFKPFRDLKNSIEEASKNHDIEFEIKAPFPPTFNRSRFGVKLTEAQITERESLLNDWVAEVISRMKEMPDSIVEQAEEFFDIQTLESRARQHSAAAKVMQKNLKKKEKKPEEAPKEDPAPAVDMEDVSIESPPPAAGCGCIIS